MAGMIPNIRDPSRVLLSLDGYQIATTEMHFTVGAAVRLFTEAVVTLSGRTGINSVLNGVYNRVDGQELFIKDTKRRKTTPLWMWKLPNSDWFIGDHEDIGKRMGYAHFKADAGVWHVANNASQVTSIRAGGRDRSIG